MPKKFSTENSKAEAARARKAAGNEAKHAEIKRKEKEIEDAYWQDDDKHRQKQQKKKEELERKKQQVLEKKAEAKALLEQEMSALKPQKADAPQKVTRAQIDSQKASSSKSDKTSVETHLTAPLEENINRLKIEGEEARSVTEAISILSKQGDANDKHPEKRMKAAYLAYEERRLAELKLSNPSLRLSQLKQMVFKEWQKSPENPTNQN